MVKGRLRGKVFFCSSRSWIFSGRSATAGDAPGEDMWTTLPAVLFIL